jgi:hypothetical protein
VGSSVAYLHVCLCSQVSNDVMPKRASELKHRAGYIVCLGTAYVREEVATASAPNAACRRDRIRCELLERKERKRVVSLSKDIGISECEEGKHIQGTIGRRCARDLVETRYSEEDEHVFDAVQCLPGD